MTKGKARARAFKAFAAQLRLIWLQESIGRKRSKWMVDQWRHLDFKCYITPTIRIHFIGAGMEPNSITLDWTEGEQSSGTYVSMGFYFHQRENRTRFSAWESTSNRHEVWEMVRIGEYSEELRQFIREWMPFFRRGCWLSGCEIECTEHEKLEWTVWLREQENKAFKLK